MLFFDDKGENITRKLLGNNKMNEDKFNLKRFLDAQKSNYLDAISELKNGRKLTHWMWYVFPQVSGLGRSEMSEFFAIKASKKQRRIWLIPFYAIVMMNA